MLKLISCAIILAAVCNAQEHLTCLRTDDVLNQRSPQASQRVLQGLPGKRGAKGQTGSRGRPGQKGEPGFRDDRQLSLLRDQINSLSQEVQTLKNESRKNRLLIAGGSKWLHVPPNFYIYQLTPGTQSWQKSQEFCQNWGGDLAVYGVKSLENRKKLIRNLPIKDLFWIGANDIASEGNWVWVNGERANSSELHWWGSEPNNIGNEDCIRVIEDFTNSNAGLAYDVPCGYSHQGLCEKQI